MFGNSAIYRRSDHFLLHPLRLVTLQRQFIDEQAGELIPAVPHKPIVSGGLTSVGLLCRGVVAVNNRPQPLPLIVPGRSEEHTSELQSLMRISYAVFCLKQNISYLPLNYSPSLPQLLPLSLLLLPFYSFPYLSLSTFFFSFF